MFTRHWKNFRPVENYHHYYHRYLFTTWKRFTYCSQLVWKLKLFPSLVQMVGFFTCLFINLFSPSTFFDPEPYFELKLQPSTKLRWCFLPENRKPQAGDGFNTGGSQRDTRDKICWFCGETTHIFCERTNLRYAGSMYRNPRQFVDSRHWINWIDLIHDTRHLCMRLRIDGILAMSRGFSTSNRGRICLFNQQKTAI